MLPKSTQIEGKWPQNGAFGSQKWAKSGPKWSPKGRYGKTSPKIGRNLAKLGPKSGFGALLGSILEAKMLQNQPKKYAKKRHSKKRAPGRLAAPSWSILRSFLGGFLWQKTVQERPRTDFSAKCAIVWEPYYLPYILRVRTAQNLPKNGSGSDFGWPKTEVKTERSKNTPKTAFGSHFGKFWLPFGLHFGSKMEEKTRPKTRSKKIGKTE